MKVFISKFDLLCKEIPVPLEGKIKVRFQEMLVKINDVARTCKRTVISLPEEGILLMTAMGWQRMSPGAFESGALGLFMENPNHIIRRNDDDASENVFVSEVNEAGLFKLGNDIFAVRSEE